MFVDAVDEITDLLASTDHLIEPWQLMRNTNVIGDDGHSDYGHAFEVFWERYGKDVGPKSTVLLLGDARNKAAAVPFHRPESPEEDSAWIVVGKKVYYVSLKSRAELERRTINVIELWMWG